MNTFNAPPARVRVFPRWESYAVAVLALAGLLPAGAAPQEMPHSVFEGDTAPPSAIWLDSLDMSLVQQDWGEPRAGRSAGRNPLVLGGTRYIHGLGTHAFSECHVELFGACDRFAALIGIDDEVGPNGSAVFEVWVDGSLRWKSPVLRGGDAPVRVETGVAGAEHLVLVVDPTGDGIHLDHANWAGALLYLAENGEDRPQMTAPPPIEPPDISDVQPRKPAIHAPRVLGATPGRPFLFRIPCAGEKPISFAVRTLPGGLTLDTGTGIITGTLEDKRGVHLLDVRAQNAHGSCRFGMVLVAAPGSLALTPPMGWNSWNVWGETVDDAKVRAAAGALIATGLADYGFQYVCIDDGWAGGRDPQGAISPNDKFPDMQALVADLHEAGLKAGIYTSPGRTTCAGYEGSFEHESQDAAAFAAWGMDFLKYDWCSYSGVATGEDREMFVRPYRLMRQALDACERDMVYAICQYGMGEVWEWAPAPEVRGNLWRTTEDITDTWPSMLNNALATAAVAGFSGPGHWSDADMLALGTLGWGKGLRGTRLNPREQQTHVTLWTMLPAPLFLGCDLERVDAFTLALLRNPEIIAVHQDPAGESVRRVVESEDATTQVWARRLWDGTTAVALFNVARRGGPCDIRVSWTELELSSKPQPVRDLWRRKDLGKHSGGITFAVPPHGCALLRVGRPMKDVAALSALRRRYELVISSGG